MDAAADAALRDALERARTLIQRGERAAAIELVEGARRELAASSRNPVLSAAAGILAQDLGMLEPAEDLLARATRAEPRLGAAHAALGQVRMDLGRHDAALEAFRAAASLQPSPRASNNEGIALMALGRREEAMRAFERALQLDPGYALASFNLARLHSPHDTQRAFAHAQAAVKADPSNADAWLLLSDLMRRRHDYPEALRAVNLAIDRSPGRPAGWTARAALLAETGQGDAARSEFGAAWTGFPSDLRAALGANLTLPQVYASLDHLQACRAAYTDGLQTLHAAADRFHFNDVESALLAMRWSNFYLAYQGRDDRELQKRYGEFQRRVLERAAPDLFAARKHRPAGARVRVGFLSHYFYNCVVGRYFASWLTRLDSTRFERIAYYTNGWIADDTRAIEREIDRFHYMAGMPLAAIARKVIADELDVLVFPEVGMHPDIATFAAMRLAPVQCMAWGHPTTSGSPEMDWYLSSDSMEPQGAQAQYSERLALLPGLGTRYERPQVEGTPNREEFGLPADRTLYLVPQSLFKMHPDNDELIARVLAQDKQGLAVLFESNNAGSTRTFRTRLNAALGAAGVAEDRVTLLKPNLQHSAYLRLNAVCDVMIDTLHWSGGNTSIDAIAAALPIVTLPGALMRGRQSAAMLRVMGLDELVAGDEQAFVAKAVELGGDRSLRGRIAQRMQSARDALFAREEPIRALEDFLEAAARGA